MTDIMKNVMKSASLMEGVDPSLIIKGPVLLEHGAVGQIASFLKHELIRKAVVLADHNTYAVIGELLTELIKEEGVAVSVTLIEPDSKGDVIAEEKSLVQLILDLKTSNADVVIAVGTGTLHDIARFSAYAVNIPFISVPTAPSVDGFNSMGAPLVLRNEKKTIQAIGPMAIFADLDILTQAPNDLVAAGFGDMLGKFTSLFDWKFSSIVGGEPYSAVVSDLTKQALQQCVDNSDEIAKRTSEGIRILMQALLESGFAMLLFGQSHPASGAEHHLSHYWEMEFLRLGRKQILHGAKVGVACADISQLYHQIAQGDLPLTPIELQKTIKAEIAGIPDDQTIRHLLKRVGGPTNREDLGISEDLFRRSLKEAHLIRPNRFTLLRAYNGLH